MIKKITVYGILIILFSSIFVTSINASNLINTKRIDKTDFEKSSFYIKSKSILPSYFSWRDIDGVDFTTPIRDQGSIPSCETFAFLAAVETMVQYSVNYSFGCDLSEAHLFFYSGGNINWGSYPENDTEFLKEYGVPDEACWPYPKEYYQYPLNTTSPDWKNRTVKITNWSYLPEDRDAIKKALVTNGPVPTYFMVYRDFAYHKKGIYQHRWGEFRAPHYVTIIGYNDGSNPKTWLCKNSWGVSWNGDGYVWIAQGQGNNFETYIDGIDVWGVTLPS